MADTSFLSSAAFGGDWMSLFDPSALGAEEGFGLLDDYLEVARHSEPHGFPGDKAKAGSSEWLLVDGLVGAPDVGREDAFSGTDWMVEKVDLKEFDLDALLGFDDEFLATLDGTCDPFDSLVQESDQDPPPAASPIGPLPESVPGVEPVAPLTFLQPLALSPGVEPFAQEHSFSLELGSEVDIEGDRRAEPAACPAASVKEEDDSSDSDSGVCMSPGSSPGSPQRSPSASGSPGAGRASARPKPYDPPAEKAVAAKVKGEKLDKKLKKMEQNKTAATRYRQKKRAEQEALTGECKELEQKNEALKERADALAKEIQYLKDLIEEVRRARGRRRAP